MILITGMNMRNCMAYMYYVFFSISKYTILALFTSDEFNSVKRVKQYTFTLIQLFLLPLGRQPYPGDFRDNAVWMMGNPNWATINMHLGQVNTYTECITCPFKQP